MKAKALLMLALAAPLAYGAKSTKILRGGLGFLFPDHNSFENPAQFPITYGMAFEASYLRLDGSSQQSLTPSWVFGNGKVGLGAYYSRGGDSLTSSSATNGVGAGIGVAFLKDRVTLGVGYETSLDSGRTNDGSLEVAAALNGPKRMGPSLGLGMTTTVNQTGGDRQTARLAAGYSFRSNQNLEAGIRFSDIRDTGQWTPYLTGTFGNQFMYTGAVYSYARTTRIHSLGARLGFILGRYIDFSAFASKELTDGGGAAYAGSFRASF